MKNVPELTRENLAVLFGSGDVGTKKKWSDNSLILNEFRIINDICKNGSKNLSLVSLNQELQNKMWQADFLLHFFFIRITQFVNKAVSEKQLIFWVVTTCVTKENCF